RMYLVVRALGFDISFPLVVFLTLANALLTLVPTPGGVGAVESGVGGLAVRLSSLSASAAAALVLMDRAITYISVIILGAVFFLARQAVRRPRLADSGEAENR
ncbi:MAG: flippase-like domain-containing protein, partial [Chloroflexi bacterium]|nr:flippase-like domain-containing protein [Chloroflexota bacterium]